MDRPITTPAGKRMTDRQYIALKRAQDARDTEHDCENGHFGCAAWHRGPCTDEVLSRIPEEQP